MSNLSVGHRRRALRLPLDLLLLWVYLALLIFDFRRAAGDTGSLVVVLGLGNLGLGLVMVMRAGKISRRSLNWMLPMVAFAMASAMIGVLRGQAIYAVLSHLVPLMIFIMAVMVVCNPRHEVTRLALPSIAFFAMLSTAWKLAFGFVYSGLDVETIRYQIISGALPLLFSYGVAGVLVERQRWTGIAIGLSLLVIALSVTRSYLIVLAVSTMCAILAMPFSAVGKIARRGFILAIIGMIGLIVIGFFFPDTIERWTLRLGSSEKFGFDLTGATRVAEATYQFQRLSKDALALFFGFGQAAETRFTGQAAELVRSVLGENGVNYIGHGYGHIFYVGLIYVGGLAFGVPVIGTFLFLLCRAILRSRHWWMQMPTETRFTTIWGIAAFAGYLSFGLVGGTWGDRSMSFYFGISCALVITGSERIRINR